MASNLRKNKLDIERLEQAIYTIDLSDLTFDMMTQILATKVKHFFNPCNQGKHFSAESSITLPLHLTYISLMVMIGISILNTQILETCFFTVL